MKWAAVNPASGKKKLDHQPVQGPCPPALYVGSKEFSTRGVCGDPGCGWESVEGIAGGVYNGTDSLESAAVTIKHRCR